MSARLPTARLPESRLLRLLAWTPVPLSAGEIGALLEVNPRWLVSRLARLHLRGAIARHQVPALGHRGRQWVLKWHKREA